MLRSQPHLSPSTLEIAIDRLKSFLSALKWKQLLSVSAVLLCGLGFWWAWQAELDGVTPEGLRQMMVDAGHWGPIIYMGVLATSVVVSQIPGVPLALAAGAIWGPLWAGIYSVIGAFLGGLVAYGLGRRFGRSVLQRLTGKTISFSSERGERYIGGLILVARLLPIFSFDLISYGAGVSGLSLPIYAIATFIGMIPSTFLLTYTGATFTVGSQLGIELAALFLLAFAVIPLLMYRYNWLHFRQLICVES